MCRHAFFQVPPQPRSVPDGRRFLLECLRAWDLDPILDDAQLALSELLANAVVHASSPITVAVSCAQSTLEVAVSDGSPLTPSPRPVRHDPAGDIERAAALIRSMSDPVDDRDPGLHVGPSGSVAGGRGLLLVEAISSDWGVSPHQGGKAVWFRMPAPPKWPPGSACPCAGGEGATALASGGQVVHLPP
jgi:anti-sigma regulatory factor (Ser/Thr protein kinase)